MSDSFAGLTANFDRFREVWQIDYEYRQDKNHLPVPVALFAKEQRTGREIGALTREQLLASTRLPFDTGPDVLVTSYSIVAESSCFLQLGVPIPQNLICSYFEIAAAINGLDIEGFAKRRPGLLEACDLYGLEHSSPVRKERMRDLILNNETYTPEQWLEIDEYNRDDVLDAIRLLEKIAPTIDVERALFRGRYGVAVARMEACGIPISAHHLSRFQDNWQALRMFYIRRDDEFGLYDSKGSFKEDRFKKLLEDRGWQYGWPLTDTGKLSTRARDIGKQSATHPELKKLVTLRESIAELKLGNLLNTIGADDHSRCPIMPFWNKTARNQPFGRDKVFLFALPSWLHGAAAPPKGYGMALLDFSCQEIGIAAGRSGDPRMIADFLAGDPHIGFAIRAGLAPIGANKDSHKAVRKMIKPVSLGSQYGMTKYGVAAQTGKSLVWAETTLAIYRHTYPTFINWQQDIAAQAMFDERIESVFGWPMAVHAGTKTRTLLNFPAQSGGADIMQIVSIAATEAGIQVCAPVHDAFWIMAPLNELDDTIARMTEIMLKAGRAVAGITIPVDVQYVIRWPQCLGDVREKEDKGFEMWAEVQGLIDGGELKTAEAAE